MSAGAENFADATPIEIASDGDYYYSDSTYASLYTNALEPGEADIANNPVAPSAWWKYTPAADGVFTADTEYATGDTYLEVYTLYPGDAVVLSNLSLLPDALAFNNDNATYGNKALVSVNVTAGMTYWVRYSFYGTPNPGNVFWLHALGPHTGSVDTGPSVTFIVTNTPGVTLRVLDPPIITFTGFQVVSVVNTPTLQSSAIAPTISFIPYVLVPVTNTPGIQIKTFVLRAAQVIVTDFSPDDNTTIPTLSPIFRFTVSATDDFNIQVEIADNIAFSNPVDMLVSVDDPNGNFSTYIQSPIALLDHTTYYWRYRISYLEGGATTDWSGTYTLRTDLSLSSTVYQGSWVVGAGIAAPNIWFVYPGKGQPGDKVTIYGQALAATTTTVTLGGRSCTVVSAATYPVTDNTIDKFIDTIDAVVTVEQDRVVFVVPDVDAPGGLVIVQT